MDRSSRRLSTIAGLVVVAGCNSVFGTFEIEESGDATGGGGGSSAPCAAPSTCETAPSGWVGPVALALSEPECDGWSQALHFFEGDIDAEPVTCMPCACGAAAGATCAVLIEIFSTTNCTGTPDANATVPSNSCTPVASGYAKPSPVAAPGQCQPQGGIATPPQVTLPPPKFVCQSANAGSCEEGLCVPPALHRCVMTTGELDCPQGYPNRHRLYESVNDQRDCGCACSAPAGAACGGTLTTYSETNCSGLEFSATFGGCGLVPANYGALYQPAVVSQGSCQPSGSETGAIDLVGVTTVCCS